MSHPRLIVLALAAWMVLPAGPLRAHPMPYTAAMLDFQTDALAVELMLPLQELQLGFHAPLLDAPAEVVPRYGPALRDYLLAHIRPTAPDGRAWSVEVSDMSVKLDEVPLDLIVHLCLRPPPGAPLRKLTFNYDVIVHQVVSHKAFVFVRNDWTALHFYPADQVPPLSEAVGLIRYLVYTVPIDRTHAIWW